MKKISVDKIMEMYEAINEELKKELAATKDFLKQLEIASQREAICYFMMKIMQYCVDNNNE